MFGLHRYKCNVEKVFSSQMNNLIESHFIHTDCMHECMLLRLLSEIIMVRDGFLSLLTWFLCDLIDDVITLYPVFVFRPCALFYCFYCFYCMSVCRVLHVLFYNK